jgi:ribosome biogenesis GTPase / thiamine phosphate phosphatase
MDLVELGWNGFFKEGFAPFLNQGLVPGRVFLKKSIYQVWTENGELKAKVSGRFRYHAKGTEDFPTIGDWIAIEPDETGQSGIIHAVLPRKSKFSRKSAGTRTQEQVVAANIDTVFIVTGLDNDFNLRRIERYLTTIWESGAQPVVILNKSDLCLDVEEKRLEVESIAINVPVHFINTVTHDGIAAIYPYIIPGQTISILGSSGVGKSTIINRLLGAQVQRIGEVRKSDDRGQHTTTHRELFMLPGGGLVIDTPGMRELQLWDGAEGIENVFQDLELLAEGCRFSDCQHETEHGCAVIDAVSKGGITQERFLSYKKLLNELKTIALKQDEKIKQQEKKKLKSITKTFDRHKKR